MEISTRKNREMGNFLTSSTFDCTPGHAPDHEQDYTGWCVFLFLVRAVSKISYVWYLSNSDFYKNAT